MKDFKQLMQEHATSGEPESKFPRGTRGTEAEYDRLYKTLKSRFTERTQRIKTVCITTLKRRNLGQVMGGPGTGKSQTLLCIPWYFSQVREYLCERESAVI